MRSAVISGGAVRKGTRVDVRVEEPLDLASGRLRVFRQKVQTRAMLRLLPPDKGLAEGAAHAITDHIVRQAGKLAGSTDSPCYELQRSESKLLAEFVLRQVGGAHVADLYYVVDYVVKCRYWRKRRTTFRLRSVNARPPSWDASGLVRNAWKRLTPPTQKRLATLLEIKRTNLSKLNKGTMPMTLDYAERIKNAVLHDAPESGFTIADLGAPSSVVAEVEPSVLDRLEALEGQVADLATKKQLRAGLERLRVAIDGLANPSTPEAPPAAKGQNG
jgi:hypothetical protein